MEKENNDKGWSNYALKGKGINFTILRTRFFSTVTHILSIFRPEIISVDKVRKVYFVFK